MIPFSFYYKRKSLEELAVDAKRDRRAFDEFYRRMVEKAYGYYLRRLGSAAEAEDLTHQLFLKMYENLSQYSPSDTPFEAWFFKVARNLLIDYYRKKSSCTETPLYENITYLDPVSAIDEKITVADALASLPENYREIIYLSFFDRLSTKEIAYILDISEENVRVLKHRALKAILKVIKDER